LRVPGASGSVAVRPPARAGTASRREPLANAEIFDVTVIGSGPGGYVAAIRAAQLGLKAAVVERDPAGTGGTCLQRGCIPTKALLHTADLLEDMQRAKEFGIRAEGVELDFEMAMTRKDRIVKRLSKGIESYLFKKNKITLLKGQGRLEGPKAVIVEGEAGETKVQTKNVVLATGSRPRGLPGIAPDGKVILTSDEILEIKEIPESLIVIGAGAEPDHLDAVVGRALDHDARAGEQEGRGLEPLFHPKDHARLIR